MLVDGVLVFVILWPFARKARPRLAVGALYTLLYGCARFFTEYFRVPDWETTVLGMPITSGQVLSLPMIVGGADHAGLGVFARRQAAGAGLTFEPVP
jgi:phosphatidylglycerol:prolipoprotein diacylglycerol transferase